MIQVRLVIVAVLSLSGFAAYAKGLTANPEAPSSLRIVRGPFEQLVCTQSGNLTVRNESLEPIGTLPRFQAVKVVQGFDGTKKKKTINGKTYDFVQIQLPDVGEGNDDDTDQEIAWVPASYIKTRGDCPGASEVAQVDVTDISAARSVGIKGLNDSRCCLFPLKDRPTASYLSGMRRFGAGRSGGGRVHAAADLYGERNAPIVAVAPGKVIRNLYRFYLGTYALEVKHQGGFVVRYGEVTGRAGRGVSGGRSISAGQTIGYMGKIRTSSGRCCEPMLHFELFRGTKNGALSQRGNKYRRRSDLMNPTPFLQRWEQTTF